MAFKVLTFAIPIILIIMTILELDLIPKFKTGWRSLNSEVKKTNDDVKDSYP